MKKSVIILLYSFSVFALLYLFINQTTANASNPSNALVGAIRWDGNTGDTPTFGWANGNYVGQQVERALGPNQYHFRLPFYGVETGTNSVQARELTQSVMDQDIAYAKQALINYWAFVFYANGSGMDTARNLYDSSTHKSDVKYCFIIDSAGQMPATNFSYLVGKFGESNYQKVLGNRPILYLFSPSVYSASDITNLRNQTTAAGLGNPYIVVMDFSASGASSGANAIGADAISSYATTQGGGGAYSGLVSTENSRWTGYKDTGKKVVPWVTTGWDPRPRIDNPVTWTSYSSNSWTQTATATQIANHLQEGLNWVNNYPDVANANTVLMYAWNEFDEGGWLTPTKVVGSSAIDTSRVDAIKDVLSPTPPCVPGSNLALCKTYSASSQYDMNQTAAKAFDGTTSTNWQALSGFNGQWLEVNFGASTTFNKVVLSEYGGRTTGFRIEYWNGSVWSTAYTGTTIGNSASPSTHNFTAVTGSKARIYYTAGTNTPIMYEFEVYNDSGSGTNLATASNYSAGSAGWVNVGNVHDGSTSTAGNNPNSESWIEYSFSSPKTITQAELKEDNAGSWHVNQWKVQYYNGSWNDAFSYEAANTANWIVKDFTDVSNVTKVRLYVTKPSTGDAEVLEFKVFGTDSGGGGYTSVKDWYFNSDGNLEGWGNFYQLNATVSGGKLNLTASGTDPQMKSPDNLGVTSPSSNKNIRIRMKNNSSQTIMKIYFITNSDGTYNEAKSKSFTITPNSAYVDYVVDMSTITGWTGTIKQLRIDPLDPGVSGQTVNIDYIRVTN